MQESNIQGHSKLLRIALQDNIFRPIPYRLVAPRERVA